MRDILEVSKDDNLIAVLIDKAVFQKLALRVMSRAREEETVDAFASQVIEEYLDGDWVESREVEDGLEICAYCGGRMPTGKVPVDDTPVFCSEACADGYELYCQMYPEFVV